MNGVDREAAMWEREREQLARERAMPVWQAATVLGCMVVALALLVWVLA